MHEWDNPSYGLHDGIHRLSTGDGRKVLTKIRRHAPADFFISEARGLAALGAVHGLRVPAVLSVSPHAIVLEDLGSGRPAPEDWGRAGTRLARQHATTAAEFGFDADGYCGDSAQRNTRACDGFRFFAECRLLPQARQAFDAGIFQARDLRQVEMLCSRLRELLPERPAVLIHGDLWTGNLHPCANGELALIDAGAVHHGWAECDLAMLTLFGEPPRALFATYQSEAGIGGDWRGRAPLLNLYHLLNHLNLFGAGYLAGLRAVLSRFA